MKTLIKVNSIDELKLDADGYILGFNDFCLSFEKTFSIDEIKSIVKEYSEKEIFVSLNKMIFNNELSIYKSILFELDKLPLKGIIIGDTAALTYNLSTNLIMDQLHLNNSYLTVNHYYNNGCSGIYLTNDITLEDINYIKENSNSILFKDVFCLPHLSTSKRNLITNYLKHFNIDKKDDYFYICEEKDNNYYLIKEDKTGTHIYNAKVLNILDMLNDLKTDYVIFDSHMINKENFKEIYNDYKKGIIDNEKINKLFDFDNGFINKKTIYKVKNYE